jgi:hypothetical protein
VWVITSLVFLWLVIDMISNSLQPSTARHAAAALRTPWIEQWNKPAASYQSRTLPPNPAMVNGYQYSVIRNVLSPMVDASITSVKAGTSEILDLSRFRSGHLRAILAIKETGYGSDTQRRVQAGCSSHRDDQRPDEASGCV